MHYFLLLVGIVFLAQGSLYAEGSKDLNDTTCADCYRQYIDDTETGDGWVLTVEDTIPTTNMLYVYAEVGDSLLLASSTIGYGSGAIIYIRPDGTEVTLTGTAGSGNPGFIANRAQEMEGPYGLDNGGSGGYTPFVVEVDQTGIWQVQFKSRSPLSSNGDCNFGRRRNAQNWGSNHGRCIAAWDVSIKHSGALVKGRLFFKYLPLNPAGLSSSCTYFRAYTNYYILTRDGLQYQWNTNGYAGYGHAVFSNNTGAMDTAFNSLYQSYIFQWTPPDSIRVHPPQNADTELFSTNKVFFNEPDINMPATSAVADEGSTWLNPSLVSISGASTGYVVQGLTANMDGYFNFSLGYNQSVQVIIDVNDNGVYGDGTDPVVYGRTTVSNPSIQIFWDGLDTDSNAIPAGSCLAARFSINAGEAHFPYLDLESNSGGLEVSRTNGPGVLPDYNIHFNDMPLNDHTHLNSGFTRRTGVEGVNSAGGAQRRWARNHCSELNPTHPNSYGDRRFMDTWVYATIVEFDTLGIVCGMPMLLDANAFSLKGYKDGRNVQLSWQYKIETDQPFIIQRKLSGEEVWEEIGQLDYTEERLHFTDEFDEYLGGELLYRVAVKRLDGTYDFSTLHTEVFSPAALQMKLVPNPVQQGFIDLFIDASFTSSEYHPIVQVYNALGQSLPVEMNAWNNRIRLDVSSLPPEQLYWVRVLYRGIQGSQSFYLAK